MRRWSARAAWVMVLGCAALLLAATSAGAQAQRSQPRKAAPDSAEARRQPLLQWYADDERDRSSKAPLAAVPQPLQHGPSAGHLPPVQQELETVGKLELNGRFGNIVPEQIGDLAIKKGFAYLNSWNDPSCRRGGSYIADIRDPSKPREIGFLPAKTGYYHGEGAQVVSISTPQFTGDVLAVNDEAAGPCPEGVPAADPLTGGFDLYAVTDPANPKTLVQNAGDKSPESSLVQDPAQAANSSHSVFVWQDGPRAYLVATDNTELSDVDIYDITTPWAPEQIADLDIGTAFSRVLSGLGYGQVVYHHDVVVKRIGGRMRMLVSYWDGGYVQLDVTDPAHPTYLTDTSFAGADPLTGFDPPEGNAHEAEFSHDNQFFLAADEDFFTHRYVTRIGGQVAVPEVFFGVPVTAGGALIPELQIDVGAPLAGGTLFIGDACDPATIPPAPGETTIAVAERGGVAPGGAACSFELKATNAEAAGYDGLVIFNNFEGAEPPESSQRCEVLINMQLTYPPTVSIKTVFVGREDGLRILGALPSDYRCAHNDATSTPAPAPGTGGPALQISADFDGWGYAHLYDAATSQRLDSFAIPQALDERFAFGYGDLSIHEFATDPTENLAYTSYYSGGIRVLSFDRANGLRQTAAWIDEGGSNFWGVEQFTTPSGQRLIAGSDRDFGLVILRYTGPGAAVAPRCDAASKVTVMRRAVRVPLRCSDANGNPLTRRIVTRPRRGRLERMTADSVVYRPNRRFRGRDTFRFVANDGAADSQPATATVRVRPQNRFSMRLGKLRKGRRVVVVFKVRAQGRMATGLRARVAGRNVRLARSTKRAKRAGRLRVTLRLKRPARRRLARALRRDRNGRMRGTVRAKFKPTGGTSRTQTRKLTVRR